MQHMVDIISSCPHDGTQSKVTEVLAAGKRPAMAS
jgi:hypothetical protein